MTLTQTPHSSATSEALRRLYVVRFGVALVWAGLLLATGATSGPLLTALLVGYPLFDATAVLYQLRVDRDLQRSRVAEWVNVVVSVVVAITLGVAATASVAAALAVWGVWAVGAGLAQLLTATRNRRRGGQVPQVLSGALSVLAGAAFLAQGLQDSDSVTGLGGYALVGGIFFLVSAVRLNSLLRTRS